MINSKILQKTNLENLLLICSELKNFKPFIYFGTLLGITREGNVLKNDDDIDLCINYKFKKDVLKKVTRILEFKINKKVCNKYFIQLIRKKGKIKTFVDLYFFINHKNENFIEEKHNFFASIHLKTHSIHIPKKYIFPLKKNKNFKNMFIPKNSKALCKFFYGETWKKPLKKNSEYRFEIINHKPKLIKRSIVGGLTRNVKNLFSSKFDKN